MLILYSRVEELVTLQYGNFIILGSRWGNSPKGPAAPIGLPIRPSGASFISTNWEENTQAGVSPNARNGVSSCWSTCSIMQPPWGGRTPKSFLSPDGQSDGPGAPLNQDPFRVHRCQDIKVTRQVDCEEYVMAPCVLPCQWQECIKELCQDLA